jgi:hypothetical protein
MAEGQASTKRSRVVADGKRGSNMLRAVTEREVALANLGGGRTGAKRQA